MSRQSRGSVSKDKDKDKGNDESGEAWLCVGCKKEFKESSSRMLECERCESHHCSKCIKLTDSEYDLLNSRKDLHWYCNKCESKVFKSIHLDKEIEQKLEVFWAKVEDRLLQMNQEFKYEKQVTQTKIQAVEVVLKDLREDMNNVKAAVDKQLVQKDRELKELSTKVNEIIEGEEGEWTEVVKKQVSKSLELVSDNIEVVQNNIHQTRAEADEQRDRENRRNNVILYNVTESSGSRAEERNKDDATFSLQLFNSLQVGVSEEDLVRVFRLGKWDDPNRPSTASRPLMVQFASYSVKNLVMESLYKLKNVDQKFRGINIGHDMTPKERSECKKLVSEAKQKEADDSSGEYIYRVRGYPGEMRIVQLKARRSTLVKRP